MGKLAAAGSAIEMLLLQDQQVPDVELGNHFIEHLISDFKSMDIADGHLEDLLFVITSTFVAIDVAQVFDDFEVGELTRGRTRLGTFGACTLAQHGSCQHC